MIKYLRFRPGPKRAGLGAEVRAGQAMKTPILNCTVANKNYVIDADRKKKKKKTLHINLYFMLNFTFEIILNASQNKFQETNNLAYRSY